MEHIQPQRSLSDAPAFAQSYMLTGDDASTRRHLEPRDCDSGLPEREIPCPIRTEGRRTPNSR